MRKCIYMYLQFNGRKHVVEHNVDTHGSSDVIGNACIVARHGSGPIAKGHHS